MRKFVTVLLMVLMLWTPTRFASANDGGGIVDLITVSAFSRPITFTTVVLLSYVIVNSLFTTQIVALPPAIRTRVVLAMTAKLTLSFFQYVYINSFRYFIYSLTFPQLYFQRIPATAMTTAPAEEKQEGLWSASNPEVMKTAVALDQDKEKQELINDAVQAALRDPEVAKKYLEYATPELKAAVAKALADRARF